MKKFFLQNILLKFSFATLLLPLLFSCAKKTINDDFERKYGEQIEKIKEQRQPSSEIKKEVTVMQPAIIDEMPNPDTPSSGYYSYVDVSKFGDKKSAQNFLPNGELYERARVLGSARNMFDIIYNLEAHPPFRKAGVEFDQIAIPDSDAYGVKTEMSQKPYLLAGNDNLQKSIDQINDQKTAQDIEISQALIKEQKQLRHKEKMKDNFGFDVEEVRDFEEKQNAAKEKKKSAEVKDKKVK